MRAREAQIHQFVIIKCKETVIIARKRSRMVKAMNLLSKDFTGGMRE
jgi:hypothetical protein